MFPSYSIVAIYSYFSLVEKRKRTSQLKKILQCTI